MHLAMIPAREISFDRLHDGMARELGVFSLSDSSADSRLRIRDFVLVAIPKNVLSLLEVLFSLLIDDARSNQHYNSFAIDAALPTAAQELNHRFREHGAGYRIEDFTVVKITSTHLHEEVVRPVLAVLHAPDFAGADSEFRKAHEHYRYDRFEETVTDCLKSL